MKTIRLKAPVEAEALGTLEVGTVVFLEGVIYTGREGLYRRVLDEGQPMPADLAAISNVNFHCSPAASVQKDGGYRIGAVTATASFRFTSYLDGWFELSKARVIIGKGGMTVADYQRFFVPHGAVYLTTVGYGTGALLGRGIKQVRDVHWLKELGIAQAIWVIEVADFGPFLVESDLAGNSLFEQHNERVNASLEHLYDGLKQPALRRYGEVQNRSDEVV